MTVLQSEPQVSPALKRMLHTRVTTIDEAAWERGDLAYELGDSIETGIEKAAREGIRPGSNEYAAFLTAFARRVRLKQVAAQRAMAGHDALNATPSILLPPNFSRLS